MKVSFKRVAALALSAVLAVSCFAGCSKANDKDEQGRTIISTSNYPSAEGTAKDQYDAKVKAFMEANPDVNVQPNEYVFDRKTYYAKAAAGQLPADIRVAYTEVAPSITDGYIADITEVAKKYGYYDQINPMVMDVVAPEGQLYAIPTTAYALGLAVNVELFEKAGLVNEDGSLMVPKTWEEMAEFGKIIKEKTGVAGYITPTTNNSGGWLFTPIAWSYGVDFMEKDKDGKWKATFDTPEAVAALQFMKDLKWKYDILPSNMLIDNATAEQDFIAGKAAMMLRAPDYMPKIATYGAENNDFGMVVVPKGPKRHVTLLGGGACLFNADLTEDQLDAAFRWIAWDYSPKVTDSVKENIKNGTALSIENGQAIGIMRLTVWSEDTEGTKYERQNIRDNMNIDERNVKSYNDYVTGVANQQIEIQPEEPVCAQELYEILDKLLQEVFTNKDADCAKLIKNANNDLQVNYLDYL